jgi:hypothetical protein
MRVHRDERRPCFMIKNQPRIYYLIRNHAHRRYSINSPIHGHNVFRQQTPPQQIIQNQLNPGRTERSVYGSKRIKYGIFTALRRILFTKIRLQYIYISITGGFWSRYQRALYAT